MDAVVTLQFFQATATVMPTLFLAFALTSHFLDPSNRRKLKIEFIMFSGIPGIAFLAVLIVGFIIAELGALIVIATNTPTFSVFAMVITYIFLFAWFVGLQALNPLFQEAVSVAEQAAADEDAKVKVIHQYRLFGYAIIAGSFVLVVGGAVVFYTSRLSG
jgi:hypothetical protein